MTARVSSAHAFLSSSTISSTSIGTPTLPTMRVPPGFPATVLGLAAQVPLQPTVNSTSLYPSMAEFAFKQGPDIFSPTDLVQLPRPGMGVANPSGDLLFVPVSQYSLKDKK